MAKYSNLKVFAYPGKVASLPADKPVTGPLHVRLKPINACNHSCSYCAYRRKDLQLGENMRLADAIPFDKMVEICADMAALGVRAVTFSGGGEPLIYPHIVKTMQMLKDYGIKFATLTNGANLRGDTAHMLAVYGSWVRVSIDGWDDASYSAYRGVKSGEFDRVLKNMAAFAGMPCALGVVVNVDATNAPHVYELLGRLYKVGVKSVKIAPVVKSNDGHVNAVYHRPLVKVVRRQVAMAASDYRGMEVSNGYKADFESYAKPYSWCPSLQIRPVIGADLNVYACQDTAYCDNGLLFSVKEQSFKAGWLANKAQFMRINPSVDCHHHCQMDMLNKTIFEFLDINDVDFV